MKNKVPKIQVRSELQIVILEEYTREFNSPRFTPSDRKIRNNNTNNKKLNEVKNEKTAV